MCGDCAAEFRIGPCPRERWRLEHPALAAVLVERERQERKCAEKRAEGFEWLTCADPRMADEDKLAVLAEEFGEVARELCDARAERRPPSPNLRVELVQVAAVALAWIEALDAGEPVSEAA